MKTAGARCGDANATRRTHTAVWPRYCNTAGPLRHCADVVLREHGSSLRRALLRTSQLSVEGDNVPRKNGALGHEDNNTDNSKLELTLGMHALTVQKTGSVEADARPSSVH